MAVPQRADPPRPAVWLLPARIRFIRFAVLALWCRVGEVHGALLARSRRAAHEDAQSEVVATGG